MSKWLTRESSGPADEARRRREVIEKKADQELDHLDHFVQVRKYFDRADRNKDGKLTKDEWFTVLNSSGVPTSRCFKSKNQSCWATNQTFNLVSVF